MKGVIRTVFGNFHNANQAEQRHECKHTVTAQRQQRQKQQGRSDAHIFHNPRHRKHLHEGADDVHPEKEVCVEGSDSHRCVEQLRDRFPQNEFTGGVDEVRDKYQDSNH